MDDATFLRNFSRRGRVVLLADGTALPVPRSVVEDPDLAGATFRVNLISPEGAESGDRRTFTPGTTEYRDLPLPLLWQWQLADGHKNAVVVGRIDHIERTPKGLGNARGVFDTGPWGREAERLVRNGMVRGVSGDYSSFRATVLDKAEPEDKQIIDDKILVDASKLVAVTIVAKPAFEDCYIEILDDDQVLPNGIIEAPVAVTASALAAGGRLDLVRRLEHLEQLEAQQLSMVASAVSERVNEIRLQREREIAVMRVRSTQSLTAAWKPMPSSWLSAKAKLQPRDAFGRWIDMGSTVRWRQGNERHGGIKRGGKNAGFGSEPFKTGTVKSFDAKTGEYSIQPHGDGPEIKLQGKDLEVTKAVIPETPQEAQKLMADLPDKPTQNIIDDTNAKLGIKPDAPAMGDPDVKVGIDEPKAPAGPPVAPEEAIKAADEQKKNLTEAIQAAKADDPAIQGIGLDRLSELMGAEVVPDVGPDLSKGQEERADKRAVKDVARAAENDASGRSAQWMQREDMARSIFNNVGGKNETWEKDSEKYLRAADRLQKIGNSRLISKQRRQWLKNTYGNNAEFIDVKEERKKKAWSDAFKDRADAPAQPDAPEAPKSPEAPNAPGGGNDALWGDVDTSVDLWGDPVGTPDGDTPADAPSAPAASAPEPEPEEVAPATPQQDLWKKQVEKQIDALKAKYDGDDPLSAHDNALAEENQWGDKPTVEVPQFGSNQPTKTVTDLDPKTAYSKPLQKGESINLNEQVKKIAQQQKADADHPALIQPTQGEIDAELFDEKNGGPPAAAGDVDHVAAAADSFAQLVEDAGGIDGLADYIDEVKNAGPAGRSPGQFDAIEAKIDENTDMMDAKEEAAIRDAFNKMKKAALDAPSGETIEDLNKPKPQMAHLDDLPDPTDQALTVPDDFGKSVGDPIQDAFPAQMQGYADTLASLGLPGMPSEASPKTILAWLDQALANDKHDLSPKALRAIADLKSAINKKLAEENP